jgi:hypothetical protein
MARETLKIENKDYYSAILVNRRSQASLIFFCLIGTGFFAFLVFRNIANNGNWLHLVFPITAIGLLYNLFPSTETWLYKAWQSCPEKREQIFYR